MLIYWELFKVRGQIETLIAGHEKKESAIEHFHACCEAFPEDKYRVYVVTRFESVVLSNF